MSSTTSSLSGFLSSPRKQQRLLWISGAVLVVGVAVFLGVYLSRGSSQPATVSNVSSISSAATKPTVAPTPPKVKPSPAALKVARTFLQTAVQQTDLAAAYKIVGPDLKGGESLAQWRKASPVVAYPARNAKTTKFVVEWSHPKSLMLRVILNARKGSHVRPSLAFDLGVDRLHGRWLVNYWLAKYTIPVLSSPTNGG